MIIKKIAFGDAKEAFIEDRLTPGFNIIFSDDNNKGKTIVMQSALYAIGNEPIFPSPFAYKDYYHYVEIEFDDGKMITSCRKGNSFVVRTEKGISILDSVSELKRFLNRCGLIFPEIIKDNSKKMVDPVLLYQVFFVGQDMKDSSTIFYDSYYKKDDFWNLIYSLGGVGNTELDEFDDNETKTRIAMLVEEKRVLLEQNKILKRSSPSLELLSQKHSNAAFEAKVKKIETIRNSIIELKKNQNHALQRKTINERTLSEIRSLNRTPNSGDLYCLECGSKRIGYSSGDRAYTFDISDVDMRRNIIEAIEDKILAYQEEIDGYTLQINTFQRQMQEILKEDDVGLEAVLMYKKEMTEATDADTRIAEIDKEIKSLKTKQKTVKQKCETDKNAKAKLKENLISTMNQFYKEVDPTGNIVFDDLFSKRSSVFSGCEIAEFYLSKLYSLAVNLTHRYPIMMDYFREGELSTEKEEVVLTKFGELTNQIIFTATLKEQELGKYSSYTWINALDYSTNMSSHILSANYVERFKELLNPLMIRIQKDSV